MRQKIKEARERESEQEREARAQGKSYGDGLEKL
jgi:hypothetical protein